MLRLVAVPILVAASAAAQYAPAVAEWNQPVEPFRIAGNLYYVGSSGLSSFLFTTPAGHILLDTGFLETVPQIEANMKKLGFRVSDIRLLLISHAHYDHTGGMAEMKARTKARLLASPADAELLARGGRGDFAYGDKFPYPPVTVDGLLRDGETVRLGNTALTAHFTPGHTKGNLTWTATIAGYNVAISGGVTAPGYRLVGNTQYPEVLQDFENTFAKLRAMPCDICLSMHGWEFDLERKMRGKAPEAFIDRAGWLAFIDRAQAAVRKQAAQ
jgi:metallo-beta-lactamase class B